MTGDLMKALLGGLMTLLTASIVAFGAWLARWKLQELSREQIMNLVTEQRDFIAEKDRLLLALREEAERIQSRCSEHVRRQEELDQQILEMVRDRHRRERWIRRVVTTCEQAGVTIPPWQEER